MKTVAKDYHWWQRGILYQVYLRSFYDSNADGIGDLPGLIEKLDYLRWLGISSLWLCPIYPSPNADMGYDVRDYRDIHPDYGTLADFDRLLAEMHRRGMKLILDFVPNHTSCEHPWFAPRGSREDSYRSWYLWHDPAWDGGPPNNWLSEGGGSAWEFDAQTEQYYLHTYLREQPDLNWRSPQVRLEMLDVLRFWLDRGVDGFRVDAVAHLIKDRRLRDNPPNPDPDPDQSPPSRRQIDCYARDQAEVHEVIAWLRRIVDLYGDRIVIGEVYLGLGSLLSYYGAAGLTFPFNFEFISVRWTAPAVRAAIDRYEGKLAADDWPNWVLGNHDKSRVGSRIGRERLRIAAMLLLTLRGTPTMYYGDELGMLDREIPEQRRHDRRGLDMPGFGRDPQRTPMQWDATAKTGFTAGSPWLPVGDDCEAVNVAVERSDPDSLLNLYHDLIALRNAEPALQVGDYAPVSLHDDVVAYLRSKAEKRFLIALNFSGRSLTVPLPPPLADGRMRLATAHAEDVPEIHGDLTLEAYAGLILELPEGERSPNRPTRR